MWGYIYVYSIESGLIVRVRYNSHTRIPKVGGARLGGALGAVENRLSRLLSGGSLEFRDQGTS
jgi:hypothetical protein